MLIALPFAPNLFFVYRCNNERESESEKDKERNRERERKKRTEEEKEELDEKEKEEETEIYREREGFFRSLFSKRCFFLGKVCCNSQPWQQTPACPAP